MKHVARKRFGQHFLADRSVIHAIVGAIAPRDGDRLVEIGPGQAALTDALLECVAHLTAIELDRDLAAWLRKRYGPERLTLIEQDALRVDFGVIAGGAEGAADAAGTAGALRLVGNLPYNISSPLLVHLVPYRDRVVDQHFMLQKEVVDRIVAGPGQAAYGRLGVLLQNYYDCDALFDVPPEAFDPPPQVVSAVLRMLPRRDDVGGQGGDDFGAPPLAALESLLAQAFAQRRKMLRKTLMPWLAARGVDASMLTPTDRAEDVPVEVYRRLAWGVSRAGGERRI
ncbi:MAG: 16S rRNA (adenine(1518)-N(6)/adenine(1519)-N(6))-dimethyltransferase RsmA [Burkholderiaceae bacterium]